MNLELITGVSAKTMQLQLLSEEGVLLCSLLDDSATLGSHPVQNACILHVGIDRPPVNLYHLTKLSGCGN